MPWTALGQYLISFLTVITFFFSHIDNFLAEMGQRLPLQIKYILYLCLSQNPISCCDNFSGESDETDFPDHFPASCFAAAVCSRLNGKYLLRMVIGQRHFKIHTGEKPHKYSAHASKESTCLGYWVRYILKHTQAVEKSQTNVPPTPQQWKSTCFG